MERNNANKVKLETIAFQLFDLKVVNIVKGLGPVLNDY